MLRDIKDNNLIIVVMARGTDAEHKFQYIHPDGSTFIWSQYDVVCEGRYAIANEVKDFDFPVSWIVEDEASFVIVSFPDTIVNTDVRETRLYWKVLATHKISGVTTVIQRGEMWLK